ncbi:hypothetical protein [uncultured Alistipes sp.]|uniref:hypothetical protein n=1 Tax=uncultured Alistipes sp. TaxID=538949 RepID=UPI0026344AA3|nr:hypothetical protein [uncultured Alistipes sp.]
MDWQEAAVALIGAVVVVRLLFVVRRRRRNGGCSACDADCPFRKGENRTERRS